VVQLDRQVVERLLPQVVRPPQLHSRQLELLEQQRSTWRAQLRSPPVDGRANEELVALVARHFGCSRSAVSIKGGASGRTKWVSIDVA